MDNKLLNEQRSKIIQGLELTYQRLIDFKKTKKSPLVVSVNGKVVNLDPNNVQPTTMYKRH